MKKFETEVLAEEKQLLVSSNVALPKTGLPALSPKRSPGTVAGKAASSGGASRQNLAVCRGWQAFAYKLMKEKAAPITFGT
ncbi:MAG: hypothetical protein IT260_24465 [Saprospiraceae bacterium]|nr:hypothetical protein [Saprospiraceae bacterium]